MKRDTSRDGLDNRIRYALLTGLRPLWALSNRIRHIHEPVNRYLINNAVGFSRTRPHPLSTMAPYTSVDSLRDKHYFSRHLPPAPAPADLPSAAEVAKLFERRGSCKQSSKSTMLFASYAQWFTDGFLLSDERDRAKNHATHELDLSQVYGTSRQITNALRVRIDHVGLRGRLKSQVLRGEEYPPFLYDEQGHLKREWRGLPEPLGVQRAELPLAQKRTLFAFGGERSNTTPQTAMLNVLMLREHNRLCGEIEAAHPEWDDERVFQTARNVLTAIQLQIVIGEYINHISPYHHSFEFDPRAAWTADWNRPVWFAVEFNLLYRWHSLIPDEIRWPNRSYALEDWRLDNRPLLEVGLAAAIEATSAQPAGEIGLGNTPRALLGTELKAIEQGRLTQLAPYNDYREAMGYPRVDRFEQISSSPEICSRLRALYGSVDRVEFYVGLFAEDPRPNAALQSLLGRMVGLDAFSQALVNPLFSKHVYNVDTFSRVGMRRIQETRTLGDLVARNVKGGRELLVTMTQRGAASKPGAESALPHKTPSLRDLAGGEFIEVPS